MKVTRVEPIFLDKFLLVEIETDDGIIGLGEYTDGELWTYDPVHGSHPRVAEGPIPGFPEFQRGIPLYGHLLSIRNQCFFLGFFNDRKNSF